MTTVFVQESDDWGSGWGLSREADAACALPTWQSSFLCSQTQWLPNASLQSETLCPKVFSGCWNLLSHLSRMNE